MGDEALTGYVHRVIDVAAPRRPRLYLYHIPQFSGVPYPIDVIAGLARRNPGVLRGVKDSSGAPDYATDLARRVPGIDVFPSSEGTLASAGRHGFAGCISATTNVTGLLAQEAWQARGTAAGSAAEGKALAVREAIARSPLVPAVKWAVSRVRHDPFWRSVAPPLSPLGRAEAEELGARLDSLQPARR